MADRKTVLVSADLVKVGDLMVLQSGLPAVVVENEKRADGKIARLHYVIAGKGYHFDLQPEPGMAHFPLVEILDLSA